MKTPAYITDWVSLWNTLVKQREAARRDEPLPDAGDRWSARAAVYDARTHDRWAAKDTSREFLCSLMKSLGRPTLLDIGAGSGKWAVPLAPLAASVTAVEPSPAMARARLEENIARHNLRNITILPRAGRATACPFTTSPSRSHADAGSTTSRPSSKACRRSRGTPACGSCARRRSTASWPMRPATSSATRTTA